MHAIFFSAQVPVLPAPATIRFSCTQDFVAEVIQLYFEDSVGKIDKMGQIASSTSGAPDFNELDQLVHQVGAAGAGQGGTGEGERESGGAGRERSGAGQ